MRGNVDVYRLVRGEGEFFFCNLIEKEVSKNFAFHFLVFFFQRFFFSVHDNTVKLLKKFGKQYRFKKYTLITIASYRKVDILWALDHSTPII